MATRRKFGCFAVLWIVSFFCLSSLLLLSSLDIIYSFFVSEDSIRKEVVGFVGGEANAPASLKLLNFRVCPGRDSATYCKCSLAAADVADFKRRIIETEATHRPDGKKADLATTLQSVPATSERPYWWKPEQLPDAVVLRIGQYWFILSSSRGLLYYLDFET